MAVSRARSRSVSRREAQSTQAAIYREIEIVADMDLPLMILKKNFIYSLVLIIMVFNMFRALREEKEQKESHPYSLLLGLIDASGFFLLCYLWKDSYPRVTQNNFTMFPPAPSFGVESIAARKSAEKYRRENKEIIETIVAKLKLDPDHMNEAVVCPIDFEVLSDPAMIQNGEVFNFSAIMGWFHRNQTAPGSRAALNHTEVCNDFSLQSKIKHALQAELLKAEQSGRVRLTDTERAKLLPDRENLKVEINLHKEVSVEQSRLMYGARGKGARK